MIPVEIDLSGLKAQFGLAVKEIDMLTETCINEVTAAIYANWEALAKKNLKSTLPEYLANLNKVDKGRFAKQIILTGVLPNMLEQGASAFDMKAGFQKSNKVKYSLPVYNAKGTLVKEGSWYLTIPFRIGTPGTLGQAGFTGSMPDEIYRLMRGAPAGDSLKKNEIPEPYDVPRSREAITSPKSSQVLYDAYKHKSSIYEGLFKQSGAYGKTTQNTYGTFRRVGGNSDPLSWINRGINAYHLAEKALAATDVNLIVENEVTQYLELAI